MIQLAIGLEWKLSYWLWSKKKSCSLLKVAYRIFLLYIECLRISIES